MIRKAKGRILVRFEPEAKTIILDVSANETERYYINYVINGLKSTGVFDRIITAYTSITWDKLTDIWNWEGMTIGLTTLEQKKMTDLLFIGRRGKL